MLKPDGLLPDGTESLFEPILTYHKRNSLENAHEKMTAMDLKNLKPHHGIDVLYLCWRHAVKNLFVSMFYVGSIS